MPRQANGQYIQPANTAAVSGQTISSTAFNTLETDIGTEITNSVDRLGRSAMQAALPMGANKITGMADPTVSTDAATKNYVDTQAAFSTGDVKLTLKTTADSGWLLCLDQTFGSASSNATFASATAQALFLLIYANVSDANAPVLTSSGVLSSRGAQGTAATAWAANCQLTLPKMLGRALAVAGSGASLTARPLGSTVGVESQALSTSNLPPYTPAGGLGGSITVSSTSSNFQFTTGVQGAQSGGGFNAPVNNGATVVSTGLLNGGGSTGIFIGSPQGGTSTAFSIMSPETFLTAMIKL